MVNNVSNVNGNEYQNLDNKNTMKPKEEQGEKAIFDKYYEWNSYETLDKLLEGGTVEEFEMFDAVGEKMTNETYVENLTEFASGVMQKFDKNEDGSWSLNEFVNMMTDGLSVTDYIESMDPDGVLTPQAKQELHIQFMEMQKTLFRGFQMDNNDKAINAEEFASQFFMADMNDKGKVDGKLDFTVMNTFASDTSVENIYNLDVRDRKSMYDNVIKPALHPEIKDEEE